MSTWREDATPPPFANRTVIAETTTTQQVSNSSSSSSPLHGGGSSVTPILYSRTVSERITITQVKEEDPVASLEQVHLSIGSDAGAAAPEQVRLSLDVSEKEEDTNVSSEAAVTERTIMDDLPSLPNDAVAESAGNSNAPGGVGPVSLSDIMLMEEDEV